MTPSEVSKTQKVDAYVARARPLEDGDLERMHQLTVNVYWPHRPRDLELLMSLGRGYLAMDDIERVLASGMFFEMGPDFAMIGMMMTAPRLQTHGAGRWLLDRILADCQGRDLRLNATRPAYRLYKSSGFTPVATVYQHQGVVRECPAFDEAPGVRIRPVTPADAAALRALDLSAFGAERQTVLTTLMEAGNGSVAVRDDEIVGFALIRDFGRGRVIGPVVAEDERMTMTLIAPFMADHRGEFLRLDTPGESPMLADFLASAGLGLYDTVTQMRMGAPRGGEGAVRTYGLAAQTLG
ncbi:GNAT family N-acetyltransferase [Salinicola aestuarinus]|uniref:GNAT family N-acetyltransferase n=1 Tax=Salinicola aestuarinus TaxID=1949082 RepID=UPI000DA14017|nr:GNAT family N-acetyltransferase [Salinicola aestuarinus]